jgi:hypothetical protein
MSNGEETMNKVYARLAQEAAQEAVRAEAESERFAEREREANADTTCHGIGEACGHPLCECTEETTTKETTCANCCGPVSAVALDLCLRFVWPEPECLGCQREAINHAGLSEDERHPEHEAALAAAEGGAL